MSAQSAQPAPLAYMAYREPPGTLTLSTPPPPPLWLFPPPPRSRTDRGIDDSPPRLSPTPAVVAHGPRRGDPPSLPRALWIGSAPALTASIPQPPGGPVADHHCLRTPPTRHRPRRLAALVPGDPDAAPSSSSSPSPLTRTLRLPCELSPPLLHAHTLTRRRREHPPGLSLFPRPRGRRAPHAHTLTRHRPSPVRGHAPALPPGRTRLRLTLLAAARICPAATLPATTPPPWPAPHRAPVASPRLPDRARPWSGAPISALLAPAPAKAIGH